MILISQAVLQDSTLAERVRDDLRAPSLLAEQPLEQVGKRDRGACSSGWGVQSWCMVRPSGTRGAGSTSVGRPIHIMSRELALVAGRPCDQPGCAESAAPGMPRCRSAPSCNACWGTTRRILDLETKGQRYQASRFAGATGRTRGYSADRV
jgi:hypothetical protein